MADYTYDIQKLYLEMFLADAETFVRVQNIFDPESFDRKLQPVAEKLKAYVDKYKVMPELKIIKAIMKFCTEFFSTNRFTFSRLINFKLLIVEAKLSDLRRPHNQDIWYIITKFFNYYRRLSIFNY